MERMDERTETEEENNCEETDSSGSDYEVDECDGGRIQTAKRKILKFVKKIRQKIEEPSTKYKLEDVSKTSDEYNFNFQKRGCCLIINNDTFTNMPPRPGSTSDVYNLKAEFLNLGFSVKIYNNLTGPNMDKKLRKVAQKYEHENADCFVCIMLSHGDEDINHRQERKDVVFGTDGICVSVAYAMNLFSDDECPGLMGKPRLFFIQACRGEKTEKGVDIKLVKTSVKNSGSGDRQSSKDKTDGIDDQPDARPALAEEAPVEKSLKSPDLNPPIQSTSESELEEDEINPPAQSTSESEDEEDEIDHYMQGLEKLVTSPSPCYKDSMVMFASPPGYFAFRRQNGSWFLKSLTTVLKQSNKSIDLMKMLTHVSYYMAMKYQSENKKKKDIDGCKVIPCIISMLTRDIIFTPKSS
ncbi:caspase-7 [Patella vulgata]|uniref:caspase-7 n=1 Tax=Patella vulgata TaxID=6465 RepID=UPI0024A91E56|nr:caspase-7 [Patella vulgata]